ncbi:MAG: type II toxin-antitoxin system MqsA family antitoxin [Methanomicrobiales archaeon]
MIPERCTFCKGTMQEGKTEFIARVGDEIIAIREVPACICDRCGEAAEVSRKIDAVMRDVHSGRLCCRPLAAGEIELTAEDVVRIRGPVGGDLLDMRPTIPAFARGLRFS